ncbi:hypothetical protein [Streptomyces sp. MMS24-I29]|uniref:hypothetical protein n=1 Tax=Streptomyces sp. MMS24-I29 TaxID=3351480 RepID=UPI003C7A9B0D
MDRSDQTHTVDGAEIVPGMRVLDYDRKWGIVDPTQFTRGGDFDPGGKHFDGWYDIVRDDGSTSRMNSTRLTTQAPYEMPDLLECGHPPVPVEISTGYARDADTGDRRCYPCADAKQRTEMQSPDAWTGYIGSDRQRFTTWSGGLLGKVTSYTVESRDRYTPSGGQYRMRRVTVRTPDGAIWRGRSSTAMDVITIRRVTTDGNGPKVLRDLLKF